MEQANYRVKFSLGTKLVLSLSLLFLVIVGFLSYSAVKLVVEDKQAYTFQLQSMEAHIAGQDFSERVRPAVDNLRLFLTAFDPRLPLTPTQQENLSNIAKSQQEVALFRAWLVKADGSATLLTTSPQPDVVAKLGLDPDKLKLDGPMLQRLRAKTIESTFAFDTFTVPGVAPLLVVAFADVGLKDYENGMPIGIAFLDSRSLIANSRFGETTIATPDGRVLASTNPAKMLDPAAATAHPVFSGAASSKLASGTREFEMSGISFLGAYRRLPLGPIVFTQIEKRKAMAAAFTLGERLGMLGLISIVAAILFAMIFSSTITKSLKRLTVATTQVARGDFNVDPKITTSDEVGVLARSFSAMSRKIQELILEQVKKTHLEEELKVAAAVQESLLPAPSYRDEHFEIHGSYQSAAECGGDWWGFFRIGNKLALMIADATGHGVPSALVTASARSCFSVLAKLAAEQAFFKLSPGEMMSYANRVIYDAATTKIMMTFFIGIVDLETKTITYANAGHNPPWLFRRNGERYQLKSLVPKGNRLGEVQESGVYEEMSAPIAIEDILVLYTDGLMENKHPKTGEQFGKKRSKETIEKNLDGGPAGVIEALKKAYLEYNGSEKMLDDDITLAAIRIHSDLPSA
jgi:serine phosphatase RsbU (regulator of sigma subunit)